MPANEILEIHTWDRQYGDTLRGGHVHMCPECFEDVPCDDWCTWDGESKTNAGIPTLHPVECEPCRQVREQYQDLGAGI